MKFLIFFYLITTTLLFGEGNIYYKEDILVKDDLYYLKNSNDKLNGKLKLIDKNNNLFQVIDIKNGMHNGQIITYYDNGNIQTIHNYKNDILIDNIKSYWYEGSLQSEVSIESGVRNGLMKTYYKNGQISSKINFENDNPISGITIEKNGKVSKLSKKNLINFFK